MSIPSEEGDTTVVPLTDVHNIIGIYCYASWPVQFPITTSLPTKLSYVHTILCEDLDSVITKLTYKHIASAVKKDVVRIFQFTICCAFTAEASTKCEVRIEDLDSMIGFFSNEDLVGVRVYGNAFRILEL